MRSLKTPRRGLTLIEVIVVIGILSILIGLLIPAIQKVRESAVRAQNMNNHKQIILGVHQLADKDGKISKLTRHAMTGTTEDLTNNYSIFVRLLPIVHGPSPVFKAGMSYPDYVAIFEPPVEVYHNPADPTWDDPVFSMRTAKISYAFNMLAFDGSISFTSSLPDGASNIIAFGDSYYCKSVSPQSHRTYVYLQDPINNEIYGHGVRLLPMRAGKT